MKNQAKNHENTKVSKEPKWKLQKVHPACGSENEKDVGEKMDFG